MPDHAGSRDPRRRSSRRTTCGASSPTRSTRSSRAPRGARSCRCVGADTVVVGPRHAAELAGHGRRLRRRRRRGRRRRDPDRPGLDRPALLRLRPPRPPGRDVHRQPQPGPVQRHQDVPRGAQPDRHGDRPGRDPRRGRRRRRRRPARQGTITEHDVLEAYAAHLLSPGAGHRPPAQGRRRRRQRHGRAHRPGGVRPARRGPRRASCRCTSSSTAPSPTTRPTRSTRPTWSTSQARSWPRAPTSAWPSTATPTAASWSTSAASRSARRRSPR